MGKLNDKVAFVTGAARGQGRSHAIRLAQEGANVIAIDLCEPVKTIAYPLGTQDDLDETARLVEKEGRHILARKVDTRDRTAIDQVLADGVAEFGRLDVVVANAGVCGVHAHQDISTRDWDDMIGINLTGTFNTVQASLHHVIQGGRGGSVIITSSCSSLRVVPNLSHYIAAKSGIDGYMRAIALEFAPQRIRINTVHPTNVDTGMIQNESMRRLFLPDEDHPTREMSEPIYATTTAMQIPWVQPEDISDTVAFLASDEAKFITGASVPVDAGFALL